MPGHQDEIRVAITCIHSGTRHTMVSLLGMSITSRRGRCRVLNWRRRQRRSLLLGRPKFPNTQIGNLPDFISTSLRSNKSAAVFSKSRIIIIAQVIQENPIRPQSSRWAYLRTSCSSRASNPPGAVSKRHSNYIHS
jgi:hypothetical protein